MKFFALAARPVRKQVKMQVEVDEVNGSLLKYRLLHIRVVTQLRKGVICFCVNKKIDPLLCPIEKDSVWQLIRQIDRISIPSRSDGALSDKFPDKNLWKKFSNFAVNSKYK